MHGEIKRSSKEQSIPRIISSLCTYHCFSGVFEGEGQWGKSYHIDRYATSICTIIQKRKYSYYFVNKICFVLLYVYYNFGGLTFLNGLISLRS